MEAVSRLRAMASLCRQSAAHHPDRSWKLLAEAEYWEHLAAAALSDHVKECAPPARTNERGPKPLPTKNTREPIAPT
ncbi:hypothetical protein ABIF38_002866 [Bradyrhizobium japonicum]|uniref:Uncharacterized protein n=1 Tax=Bradyrhizobium elkanii TaxID=29448 RepID=A0ABV4FCZ5_BRAEL|nr:hypothetical protein [Bradyrhizobium elkanii]MCP1734822.1 hypothetical protein [Bradyrhizobium elkanii]MCP1752929.1 hypothetical protein [Bradyrhizobium elkanii]MCP1975323.1 hypothetical protein [Bradyrhizobium elkanii]MCS3570161.1 hypothetical protein [Bradyrhizobium elkanii]